MAVLKVARMGHPVLRRVAEAVRDPVDPEILSLIKDMSETMHDAPGVGLAAPQILVGRRVILFRAPADRTDGGEEMPETALINPEIEPVDERIGLGWEGCLSVPGLRGLVPRYKNIVYRGWLPDGTFIERTATGFSARVIQHEFDHLDGILYIDRMHDLRLLVYEEEMVNFRFEEYVDNDDSEN
ncbi:MAG: peptide deformylase [Rhodospirillaceae bacterium]